MATVSWSGDALAVAHVEEGNVGGTGEVGDLFTCTIGNKSFTHVSTTATLATTADAIASAWNALSPSYYPEFAEITALGNGDGTYSLTADTLGKPFTVTLTEADGGGTDDQTHTLTDPNPTDNSGPNSYGTAGNWSGSAVPLGADDVVLENSTDSITYGLARPAGTLTTRADDDTGIVTLPTGHGITDSGTVSLSWSGGGRGDMTVTAYDATTVSVDVGDGDNLPAQDTAVSVHLDLTSLSAKASFTGDIGLPGRNASGYDEYRQEYLQVGATMITIGQGDGDGSGRIKQDSGATLTTLNIYKTGRRAEAGVPSLLWKGTHASNVVTVNRGDLGVAFFAGEVATILTLNVGYINTPLTDSKVHLGSGVTLTTANIDGGQTTILNAVTTINQTAGEVTVGEDATVGTLNLDGGTCYYKSTGTCTSADIDDGAVLDFRQDGRGRTFMNCTVHRGGAVYDPNGTVDWDSPISCPDGLDNVTLELGPSVTVTA